MHNFYFNFFFLKKFSDGIRHFFTRKSPLNRVSLSCINLISCLIDKVIKSSTSDPPMGKLPIFYEIIIPVLGINQHTIINSIKFIVI